MNILLDDAHKKMTNLHDNVTTIKGLGPRYSDKLKSLHIHTILDLLLHLPLRYQDRTRLLALSDLQAGDSAVVQGVVLRHEIQFRKRRMLLVYLQDKSNFCLTLRFFYFNQTQIERLFTVGSTLRCFGEVRQVGYQYEMIHPECQALSATNVLENPALQAHLTPIYPSIDGISQQQWRRWLEQALKALEPMSEDQFDQQLKMFWPQAAVSFKEALHTLHQPTPDIAMSVLEQYQHPAQKRLAFEELLAHHVSMQKKKTVWQEQHAVALPCDKTAEHDFLKQLPFELTAAQKNVYAEISSDLAQPKPMLRLLQGDVGAGKTVVAALALLQAVSQGYQAAFMAPSELLAVQHAGQLQAWFPCFNKKIALLTGRLTPAQRRNMYADIAAGQVDIIVGTHALFQDDLHFAKLALVIIDEQHRFGVMQRLRLRDKGVSQQQVPHQLMMTATPIPRTLAMTFYADLDVSVIDALPPGRTPIITKALPQTRRDEVIQALRHACDEQQQVYWVCPLIEDSEVLQAQAAETTCAQLTQDLPEYKIGLVHGRLKSLEKEAIMQQFKAGNLHILVATTVIEVGVDVPNASVMVIDDAQRLGLAQLHQLRGRVGRGTIASYCLLLYNPPLSEQAKARLAVLRETTDGFVIAGRDLELRGPGELLGTKQTGDQRFKVADFHRDSSLLPLVQKVAQSMSLHMPHLIEQLIQRWLPHQVQFKEV